MKLMRIVLTVMLIPTFAFMAVCICACPNAQAAGSHQLEFHKKTHCCCPSAPMNQNFNRSAGTVMTSLLKFFNESHGCPENDNHCKNEVVSIQKDVASGTESFQLSELQDLISSIGAASSVSHDPSLQHSSVLPAAFSPPGILSVTSSVLLI